MSCMKDVGANQQSMHVNVLPTLLELAIEGTLFYYIGVATVDRMMKMPLLRMY